MNTFIYSILFISLYMIIHNISIIWIINVLSVFIKKDQIADELIEKISIIIPVFNEETQIVNKIQNTLSVIDDIGIPYEVLIGSDGSQDKTREITKDYLHNNNLNHFRLLEFENSGKGQTLNKLVKNATGDLIISTDADTEIDTDAIKKILHAFREDKYLGCLSCVPIFRAKKMGIQAVYWDYELKLRDSESKIGKLIVVTGWLYAYKKCLFKDIPERAMADDLWIPLTILLQGYKSIHLQSVKCFSEKTDESTEVKRRKRVISGGVDIVIRLQDHLLKKPLLFFIIFSHKINRWLLPFWSILVFITSLAINPLFMLLHAGLFFFLLIYLGPKQFMHLFYSIITPLFSLNKLSGKRDLSKWGHTRKI